MPSDLIAPAPYLEAKDTESTIYLAVKSIRRPLLSLSCFTLRAAGKVAMVINVPCSLLWYILAYIILK